jgi:flagellar M-ring protein FliF
MSEFFKQLIAQLSAIWQKLSLQQKVVTSALLGFTVLGLIGLMVWARGTAPMTGYKTLYSDLPIEEASTITGKLTESKMKYKLTNEGKTILVEGKVIYEARMLLARDGLPKSHGIGYELFDKTNLAMTDFVQKINARRALEGELQRTIEGVEDVKAVRVHLAIPQPTIFLEQQEQPKASVMVRMAPGAELSEDQVRGITHLVSSSVEGLKADNISIVDFGGKLLSAPYAGDETAMASSRNLELQHKVEKYLEKNSENMLVTVLGPNKAKIKVSVDLDFDQVEKTLEQYNPESRVIRSEERNDENVKNAPTGDAQKERSLTNYEIDKTLQRVVAEVGNVKRLTIAVAVDGRYAVGSDKKDTYTPRTPQELQQLEEIVKNAVGYDLARGDQITLSNIQFDNDYLRRQQRDMADAEWKEMVLTIIKYVAAFLLGLAFIFLLRSIARSVAEAMNPPVPKLEILGMPEPVPVEVPEEMRKSSELLDRVEMLTREQPVNIAAIIRQWLHDPGAAAAAAAPAKKGGK